MLKLDKKPYFKVFSSKNIILKGAQMKKIFILCFLLIIYNISSAANEHLRNYIGTMYYYGADAYFPSTSGIGGLSTLYKYYNANDHITVSNIYGTANVGCGLAALMDPSTLLLYDELSPYESMDIKATSSDIYMLVCAYVSGDYGDGIITFVDGASSSRKSVDTEKNLDKDTKNKIENALKKMFE